MTIPAAVPFQEFKAHLNITVDADDDELSTTLGAATGVVEGIIGPIIVRGFTERARSAGSLLLSKYPVVSVATVTHARGTDGPFVTADVLVDEDTGLVEHVDGRNFWPGSWTVAYTAGRWETEYSVPDDVRLAVCIIGKHLWETQRGTASRPGMLGRTSGVDPTERVPMGFAVPNRAATLLEPYAQSSTGVA